MRHTIRDCMGQALRHLPRHPEYELHGYIHYSFIIQAGRILSMGINRRAEPEEWFGYPDNSSMHSEYVAWTKAKSMINANISFQVVNFRLNRQGEMRNSKPCGCCMQFLKNLGCDKVWFTTAHGAIVKMNFKEI